MLSAALLCGSVPALAAPAPGVLQPAVVTVAPLPAAPAVEAHYALRGQAPIWLRDAATLEAAKRLPAILERARLDGLADGPELARRVEAALARAQAAASADPKTKASTVLADDKLLSAAWVQYVRALSGPVPGMLYGDPALAPRPPQPHRILAEAAKAPSLAQHVQSVAAVNPLYAQLRDAAWNQAQRSGGAALDPRLKTNLDRARLLPAGGRYIVVNAATAQLWAYEDGRAVDTMKVIVGKRDTPTPMLAGTIHYVTFNPYWNIPTDVARRAVAPLVLKRGVAYLRAAQYEVTSDWSATAPVLAPDGIDWKAVAAGTSEVKLRQRPGANNMMGAIKFGFANDLGIYLHDTPHKTLFDKPRRTFSLGCVRVEDAQRFARWLLGREPVAPSADPEQHVKLDKGVPIYITYLTAKAEGGQLAWAEDVYGLEPEAETGLAAVVAPGTIASAAALTEVSGGAAQAVEVAPASATVAEAAAGPGSR